MADEKEAFLKSWDREVRVTLNVLRNYPVDKAEMKPAEKCKTARELAWGFVAESEVLADAALKGVLDFAGMPQITGTLPEIIARFEKSAAVTAERVKTMPDADWNGEMDFMVGPGKMAKVRRGDILWLTLNDMIHHRGQYSIYNRIAGGKVPSIYGPSADEPWR